MRRSVAFLLLLLLALPVLAKPSKLAQSGFVTARREAFRDSFGMRQDKDLAKEFGFGTGVYSNTDKDATVTMPFEWFMWCGPDGLVMIQINVPISYQDRYNIMVETDQGSDRPWDAVNEDRETFLSMDNKWTGCVAKKDCDFHAILDSYLQKLMKFSFLKEMKVAIYL